MSSVRGQADTLHSDKEARGKLTVLVHIHMCPQLYYLREALPACSGGAVHLLGSADASKLTATACNASAQNQ